MLTIDITNPKSLPFTGETGGAREAAAHAAEAAAEAGGLKLTIVNYS